MGAGILDAATCVGICPSNTGIPCIGLSFEKCLKSSDGSTTRFHGSQCGWGRAAASCAPALFFMDRGLTDYEIASCQDFPTASPTTASPITASPTTASPT